MRKFLPWRKNKLRCELVRLQVLRVTAGPRGKGGGNAFAAARLILLLRGKVPTEKPLAASPAGVLLRRGHAYPDRKSTPTHPSLPSPFFPSLPVPSLEHRRRPPIDLRARKTWRTLRGKNGRLKKQGCIEVIRIYGVDQRQLTRTQARMCDENNSLENCVCVNNIKY